MVKQPKTNWSLYYNFLYSPGVIPSIFLNNLVEIVCIRKSDLTADLFYRFIRKTKHLFC